MQAVMDALDRAIGARMDARKFFDIVYKTEDVRIHKVILEKSIRTGSESIISLVAGERLVPASSKWTGRHFARSQSCIY
jgi:hypothetical protein